MEKVSHINPNVGLLISQLSSPSKNIIEDNIQQNSYDLVVFSHLRWGFVFQRPQHLMERFSKTQKILFVEEPIEFSPEQENTANIIKVNKNLTVLQPRVSQENWEKKTGAIVQKQLQKMKIETPVLWFYSPMFMPVASLIKHSLVVYDSMDELAAFKNAPQKLIEREKMLFQKADVIFTGGKSLFESKRQHHEEVYCFPSSVDDSHFAKASLPQTKLPQDLSRIAGPRVGFYGVIDERLDLELIEKVARRLPDFSFVMIGPVVKISEADLPRLKNIHYLGAKKYSELPRYLKGIDVAMMPFALNEATRFISPTKTLEFMAAHKPIVSTPIKDVARDYSHEVCIASSVVEFSLGIEKYLHESLTQRMFRHQLQNAVLRKTSWDKTAQEMKKILMMHLRTPMPSFGREVKLSHQLPSSALTLNMSV